MDSLEWNSMFGVKSFFIGVKIRTFYKKNRIMVLLFKKK